MACFFITNKSARDVVLNYLLNCRHIQLYPLGSSPLEFPYELPDRIDSFQNSDAELVSPPKMESPAGFELSQHGGLGTLEQAHETSAPRSQTYREEFEPRMLSSHVCFQLLFDLPPKSFTPMTAQVTIQISRFPQT